eukprot:scaffold298313_cov25-Prasinocladus_malaysianus.AAC.1
MVLLVVAMPEGDTPQEAPGVDTVPEGMVVVAVVEATRMLEATAVGVTKAAEAMLLVAVVVTEVVAAGTVVVAT